MKEASHQGKELISHSTKRIPESRNVPNYVKGSVTSAFTFSFFFTCKELLMNDLKSGQGKEAKRREGLKKQI